MRYLGSTIVLRDEACFCQFEGPSSAAVAEANRQAGLPFDRIVAAVTVNPKGAEMSTSPSIPATVEIKRGRFISLVGAVAALAAAVTWIAGRVRVRQRQLDGDVEQRSGIRDLQSASARVPARDGRGRPRFDAGRGGDARKVPSIMSLTPAGLAEGALGTGYALPDRPERPDAGVRARLDEPADAAVHEGDHAADLRSTRRGSSRASVTYARPGGENVPLSPPGCG